MAKNHFFSLPSHFSKLEDPNLDPEFLDTPVFISRFSRKI